MLLEFFNIMSSAQVGKRIDCLGEIGTIKYIGSVEGYPATWLGIDWDNPQRGKHNGTVNGVQYFITRYPKSGSFVRPEKVNFGISAVEAITSRYGQKEDEISAKINEQQLLTIQKTINAPFLQLVGFDKITDKQANFNSLEVVNIRMQSVSTSGAPMELYSIFPNIKELDISKNLLNDWCVIFDICNQLENLKWLNVSENLLMMPKDYENYQFKNLEVLICSNMQLTWNDVLKLSKVFPNLQELRVPLNNISTIDIPCKSTFKCLKLLDLEGNQFRSWSELNKLGELPLLEHLIVEDCNLYEIKFPGNGEKNIKAFSNLKKLVLNKNNLKTWQSIEELNRLQKLEDLRILKNPIMETESYNTCVQMFIARLANLKLINGSEIDMGERKGAEYDYLKKYGMEWLSVMNVPNKREQFLSKHGRYLELLKLYGTPEESEMKVQSNLIKVSLIDVTLVYDGKTIVKKLPPTFLIQKLIMMTQRIFNLKEQPKLLYTSGDVQIELNDEGKELGFYSIQSKDKIIVQT